MPSLLFADRSPASLSPELLRAARWVDANPREVALRSMRECARQADLAPATFSRMARALGFAGFDSLKAHCQESLELPANFAQRARVLQASARREGDWFEVLKEAQRANSGSIAGLNQRQALERAARSMLSASRVHFLGLRACHGLAVHLNYTYGLIAGNGVLVQGLGGTLADQIGLIGPGHLLVAVSLSPYTRETVDAADQVRRQGAQLLALTDSLASPIAAQASQTLLFQAESPSFFQSMVGALALGEALVAAVAVKGGRPVLDHLNAAQARLDRQGAYWDSPPRKPSRARAGMATKERS